MTTPTGFKEAFKDFAAGGWIGLSGDPTYGGQGLPYVLAAAINEFVTSANMAFGMYPGLIQGAIAALTLHGSDEQKKLYLPKLDLGRMGGHDEPDRAAGGHRPRPDPHAGDAEPATAAMRSPARRSSSRAASTT